MGIIDDLPVSGRKNEPLALESDTIVASVFLGFLRHGLEAGRAMRWDVEPSSGDGGAAGEEEREGLHAVLGPLIECVAADLGVSVPDDFAGIGPAHGGERPGIATYGLGATDVLPPPAPRTPEIRALVEALVAPRRPHEGPRDEAIDGLRDDYLDHEYGAYYGVVDHPENVPPQLVSSVRRLIGYRDEGGRWDRDRAFHGLIRYDDYADPAELREAIREDHRREPFDDEGRPAPDRRAWRRQAGSIEPTGLIAAWNEDDGGMGGKVCGYCHGMIWAVAQTRTRFGGGVAYELALGEKTKKLSSCFGCSTFLYANGLAPSSMHLGRSDSWVPLPEDDDTAAFLAPDLDRVLTHGDVERVLVVVQGLNAAWASGVAGWMAAGSDIIRRDAGSTLFRREAVACASALHGRIEALARARDERRIANLFLDALTVHEKDLTRLRNVLRPAPSTGREADGSRRT